MNHGLTERDISLIHTAVTSFPEIDRVILFGSRAMGTCKPGSDVDLAVVGTEVSRETIIRFSGLLNEELPLPYFFDVIWYDMLANRELLDHIDQYGSIIYTKSLTSRPY